MLQMAVEVLTAVLGHGVWEGDLPGGLGSVKVVFMTGATALTAWVTLGSIIRVFKFDR